MAAYNSRNSKSTTPTTSLAEHATQELLPAAASVAHPSVSGVYSTEDTLEHLKDNLELNDYPAVYTGGLHYNPILHGVDEDDWTLQDYRRDLAGKTVAGWGVETPEQRDKRISNAVKKIEGRAQKEVNEIMKMKPYTPEYHEGMTSASLTQNPAYVPLIALGEQDIGPMSYGEEPRRPHWLHNVELKEKRLGKGTPKVNQAITRADMAEMQIFSSHSGAFASHSRQQVKSAELGAHNVVEGCRSRRKVHRQGFHSSPPPPPRSNTSRSSKSASSDSTIDETLAPVATTAKSKQSRKVPKMPAKGLFHTPKAAPRSSKKRSAAAMEVKIKSKNSHTISGAPLAPFSKKPRLDTQFASQSAPTLSSYRLVPKPETEEEYRKRQAAVAIIEAKKAGYEALQAAKWATRDD